MANALGVAMRRSRRPPGHKPVEFDGVVLQPRRSSGPPEDGSGCPDVPAALAALTDAELDARLDRFERLIAQAHPKDLPYLNNGLETLLVEQVRRDLLLEEKRRAQ